MISGKAIQDQNIDIKKMQAGAAMTIPVDSEQSREVFKAVPGMENFLRR